MLGWFVYTVASYSIVPAATYLGATLSAKIGINIAGKIWKCVSDGVRGVVTVTLKKSRMYVVCRGEVIELDPRKKYTIVRGEVHVEENLTINMDPMHDWQML